MLAPLDLVEDRPRPRFDPELLLRDFDLKEAPAPGQAANGVRTKSCSWHLTRSKQRTIAEVTLLTTLEASTSRRGCTFLRFVLTSSAWTCYRRLKMYVSVPKQLSYFLLRTIGEVPFLTTLETGHGRSVIVRRACIQTLCTPLLCGELTRAC